MTGIIFFDASLGRQRRLSRRRFTAAATGMLAGAAMPSLRRAQGQATPDVTSDGAGGAIGGLESLLALLSLVPRRLVTAEGDGSSFDAGISFHYADLAGQFASLGLDQEEMFTSRSVEGTGDHAVFSRAITPLAIVSRAFTSAVDQEYAAFIGFQPWLVERVLTTGLQPDQLSLFQGGIDLDALPDAWEASGYERKTADNGADIWTIGEEGEYDVSREPFIEPALNNATVLDSGIVVFGHQFETVAEAIGLAMSGSDSLREDPAIKAGVTALPDTTVSAIGITPTYVDVASMLSTEEVQILAGTGAEEGGNESGAMPRWSAMLTGITGGFASPSFFRNDEVRLSDAAERHAANGRAKDRAIMVRLATSSHDAAAVTADIVEQRWNSWSSPVNDHPFTELMKVKGSGAIGNVAAIDFTPEGLPSIWIRLVLQRDLMPFAFEISPGDERATPAGWGVCHFH